MTPARAKCTEVLQGSSSPFSRSPQSNGFLAPKGAPRGNYTNGSVVFSSPAGPESPRLAPPGWAGFQSCGKASESITVPLHCTAGQQDSISYGPGSLGTSPGFDNLLKPVHVVRAQQRTSGVSQLSMSPSSDTSYVFGR